MTTRDYPREILTCGFFRQNCRAAIPPELPQLIVAFSIEILSLSHLNKLYKDMIENTRTNPHQKSAETNINGIRFAVISTIDANTFSKIQHFVGPIRSSIPVNVVGLTILINRPRIMHAPTDPQKEAYFKIGPSFYRHKNAYKIAEINPYLREEFEFSVEIKKIEYFKMNTKCQIKWKLNDREIDLIRFRYSEGVAINKENWAIWMDFDHIELEPIALPSIVTALEIEYKIQFISSKGKIERKAVTKRMDDGNLYIKVGRIARKMFNEIDLRKIKMILDVEIINVWTENGTDDGSRADKYNWRRMGFIEN